jgi:hypothetical protein
MKQPHTEETVKHTDTQQNTGNHKKPGRRMSAGRTGLGGREPGRGVWSGRSGRTGPKSDRRQTFRIDWFVCRFVTSLRPGWVCGACGVVMR